MKQVYIIFCLILCGVFVPECLCSSPDDIFGNLTYIIGDEDSSERVTLLNGKYRDTPKHPLLCVYYEEGDFVYGDFNSDGLEDAAVVLYDSGGGSGYFLSLAFLINDGTKLVHKSSYNLGYKVDIISLVEQHGKVRVDMLVRDKREGSGGFSKEVRNIYEYLGPTEWGSGY